jgi:hypothetical protein
MNKLLRFSLKNLMGFLLLALLIVSPVFILNKFLSGIFLHIIGIAFCMIIIVWVYPKLMGKIMPKTNYEILSRKQKQAVLIFNFVIYITLASFLFFDSSISMVIKIAPIITLIIILPQDIKKWRLLKAGDKDE